MPERATGGDAVADELLDLLDFRKAARSFRDQMT
jgi:hypothetical protein